MLIININQADKASIRMGIFPKNADPANEMSIGLPKSTFMAGMEVVIATNNTKRKLTKAFILEGKRGILIIPVPDIIADETISQKLSILMICLNFKFLLGYLLQMKISFNTIKFTQTFPPLTEVFY